MVSAASDWTASRWRATTRAAAATRAGAFSDEIIPPLGRAAPSGAWSVQNLGLGRVALQNDIYRSYFEDGNYPARTTVEAKLGAPGMLLEIECVASV